MKSLPLRHRFLSNVLLLLALTLAAGALHAQTPAAAPAGSPPGKPKAAALADELAMYSPFESPWAENKVNHTLEGHLFNLMRVEVRMWALQEQAAKGSPTRADLDELSRIIHAQILSEAAEALAILQKTPNRPLASLLTHQLEAYPYEWQEEGSADLLPSLRKLTEQPAAKPTPAATTRRRVHRAAVDENE